MAKLSGREGNRIPIRSTPSTSSYLQDPCEKHPRHSDLVSVRSTPNPASRIPMRSTPSPRSL